MKRFLPFAIIFLIACNKQFIKTNQEGIVKYTIGGEALQIVDSASGSQAKWIYSPSPSKGYGLQAYVTQPGGSVLYMISFFIETDKIEINHVYLQEVTGTIFKNTTDYASTKDIVGTYIRINISQQQNKTLSGTFTGTLKNLNTNELVEISGSFSNVTIIR
jgi:hypothetical protein